MRAPPAEKRSQKRRESEHEEIEVIFIQTSAPDAEERWKNALDLLLEAAVED